MGTKQGNWVVCVIDNPNTFGYSVMQEWEARQYPTVEIAFTVPSRMSALIWMTKLNDIVAGDEESISLNQLGKEPYQP